MQNKQLIKQIKEGGPTHTNKVRLLRYYMGTECLCGTTKKEFRWDCLGCCNKRPVKEEIDLLGACNQHITAAIGLLETI